MKPSFLSPKRVAFRNRHRESVEFRFRFGGGQAHLGFDCDNDNPDRMKFEPLPTPPTAGLRELVEHSSEVALRALAFYSAAVLYCVGNGWRRLVASFPSRAPASALSPRLSEFASLPLVQAPKQASGSFSNRLETCVRGFAPAALHEQRKPRESVNDVPKVWERGTHECS